MRRLLTLLGLVLGVALWSAGAGEARAQFGAPTAPLNPYFYYPYYYFPWDYWPTQGPRWPEPLGQPYMRPPAYQAYPAFVEPQWRHEIFTPHKYYRGFHFWLDAF